MGEDSLGRQMDHGLEAKNVTRLGGGHTPKRVETRQQAATGRRDMLIKALLLRYGKGLAQWRRPICVPLERGMSPPDPRSVDTDGLPAASGIAHISLESSLNTHWPGAPRNAGDTYALGSNARAGNGGRGVLEHFCYKSL